MASNGHDLYPDRSPQSASWQIVDYDYETPPSVLPHHDPRRQMGYGLSCPCHKIAEGSGENGQLWVWLASSTQRTSGWRLLVPKARLIYLHMCADSFMVCYESRKISENPGDKGCKERKGGKRPMVE